jgi:hypothetical protein
MLLDEAVAKADSAPHPAKDLRLDSPFKKVVRAWREVPNPSEAAVSNLLQQHEPPTIVQCEDQPQDQPKAQCQDQPIARPRAWPKNQDRRCNESERYGWATLVIQLGCCCVRVNFRELRKRRSSQNSFSRQLGE